MPGTNDAFSRVKIDAQLKDRDWDVLNPNAVRFEYVLPDRTKADYVLCDRHGRALACLPRSASPHMCRPGDPPHGSLALASSSSPDGIGCMCMCTATRSL